MSRLSGFFSYARRADEHDAGRLSRLRERLQGELSLQMGFDVDIFQDVRGLHWGDQWHQEILESLMDSYFLIPVITPAYFLSDFCREEYDVFRLRQEQTAQPKPGLILPIHYVHTDTLSEPSLREQSEWAKDIHAFQWMDWRSLRLEPWESPAPNRALEKMARDLKARLRRIKMLEPSTRAALERIPEKPIEAGEEPKEGMKKPELIVDASGGGQFATITAAIHAANTDDVILVRPGTYRGCITLEKSITIIGDGERDAILVESGDANVLKARCSFGRVANLTLRQSGEKLFCVEITEGQLLLEQCDIRSLGLACVAVRGTANPTIRQCIVHDGASAGIFVYEDGRGTIEDSDVFRNAQAAVAVKGAGNPIVRRNRLREGMQGGVFVYDNGRGIFEDNDIIKNANAGVTVTEGGSPIVRRNRIRDNGFHAIWVQSGGRGSFVENELYGNGYGSWSISADSLAHVERHRNAEG